MRAKFRWLGSRVKGGISNRFDFYLGKKKSTRSETTDAKVFCELQKMVESSFARSEPRIYFPKIITISFAMQDL